MAELFLASRPGARRSLRSSAALTPAAAVAATTLVTWIATIDRMQGMDAGLGTDLGGLGWFIGVWATMMAAMMLPSVMPTTLKFARVSAENQLHARGFVRMWVFISGYLAAWTAYGLLAYGVFRAVRSAEIPALSWHAHGPLIAGATIVAAGLYQVSPLKRRCLRQCRTPRLYVGGGWRPGWVGRDPYGVRARGVLHRVLLGIDADSLRPGGDEHHVDARGGGADLRGEGAPVR